MPGVVRSAVSGVELGSQVLSFTCRVGPVGSRAFRLPISRFAQVVCCPAGRGFGFERLAWSPLGSAAVAFGDVFQALDMQKPRDVLSTGLLIGCGGTQLPMPTLVSGGDLKPFSLPTRGSGLGFIDHGIEADDDIAGSTIRIDPLRMSGRPKYFKGEARPARAGVCLRTSA